MSVVFWLVAGWLLYRLITELILPLYHSTGKAKQSFQNKKQGAAANKPVEQGTARVPQKEYIDFEEIKNP